MPRRGWGRDVELGEKTARCRVRLLSPDGHVTTPFNGLNLQACWTWLHKVKRYSRRRHAIGRTWIESPAFPATVPARVRFVAAEKRRRRSDPRLDPPPAPPR